jgi:phage-related tail fiber protein
MPIVYGLKLTAAGLAEFAAAAAESRSLDFTHMVLGDAGGDWYEVTGAEAALRNQLAICDISQVAHDAVVPNRILVDAPYGGAGGWMLREFGVKSSTGILMAIGMHPLVEIPAVGAALVDLVIRGALDVVNADVVNMTVNAGALVTRDYADNLGLGWKSSHIRPVSASCAVLPSDRIIIVDASGGEVQLTMLSAASAAARGVWIKKKATDRSDNPVVLLPAAGETVEGASPYSFAAPGEGHLYVPDGAGNWEQLNS